MRPESTRGQRTAALGRWGEQVAAEHLTALGMTVLDRNWRCREGELDLVARDSDGTLVFVEVKTRGGTGFGPPAEAVVGRKGRRLRVLAGQWLRSHAEHAEQVRIDVVGIVRRPGRSPDITHLRGVV